MPSSDKPHKPPPPTIEPQGRWNPAGEQETRTLRKKFRKGGRGGR